MNRKTHFSYCIRNWHGGFPAFVPGWVTRYVINNAIILKENSGTSLINQALISSANVFKLNTDREASRSVFHSLTFFPLISLIPWAWERTSFLKTKVFGVFYGRVNWATVNQQVLPGYTSFSFSVVSVWFTYRSAKHNTVKSTRRKWGA